MDGNNFRQEHEWKERIASLEATVSQLKGISDDSIAALNMAIPQAQEEQLPDEVRDMLKRAKEGFNLKGTTITQKQKDLNKLMDEANKLSKYYALRNNNGTV